MADVVMCEPPELYNLLNQCRRVCRLAEINYLCLIDARESQDYNTSHIITAKNAKTDSRGSFLLPVCVEVDSMRHVVVYDSSSSSRRQERGRAVACARVLAEASLRPVHIVRGGFQSFSALYPFLRTEKVMYTITIQRVNVFPARTYRRHVDMTVDCSDAAFQTNEVLTPSFTQTDWLEINDTITSGECEQRHLGELEGLKTYPVEVVAGLLYMGDERQGADAGVLRDLKIGAVVSVSQADAGALESRSMKGNRTILNVPVADSVASDLYSSFKRICSFIGSHVDTGSRVLIVSAQGQSRCSALAIAFLMHHLRYTLEEAWGYVLRCKPSMRPNTGFLQQLSDWELHTHGRKVTDVSKPYF